MIGPHGSLTFYIHHRQAGQGEECGRQKSAVAPSQPADRIIIIQGKKFPVSFGGGRGCLPRGKVDLNGTVDNKFDNIIFFCLFHKKTPKEKLSFHGHVCKFKAFQNPVISTKFTKNYHSKEIHI